MQTILKLAAISLIGYTAFIAIGNFATTQIEGETELSNRVEQRVDTTAYTN